MRNASTHMLTGPLGVRSLSSGSDLLADPATPGSVPVSHTKTSRMRELPVQRQAYISTQLAIEGSVKTSDLCRRFGVSRNTILRDLHLLEKRGGAICIQGGAINPRRSAAVLESLTPPAGFTPQPRREASAETVAMFQALDSVDALQLLLALETPKTTAQLRAELNRPDVVDSARALERVGLIACRGSAELGTWSRDVLGRQVAHLVAQLLAQLVGGGAEESPEEPVG